MNGNNYLEIEEENAERIFDDYIYAIEEGDEVIPREYVVKWIDSHLEQMKY